MVDIKTASKQAIFDFVVAAIVKQGKPAGVLVNPKEGGPVGFECRLRATDTDGTCLKCALGMLIPDEVYKPVMDRTGLKEVLSELLGRPVRLHDPNFTFFGELQDCHVSVSKEINFTQEFLRKAAQFASTFNLIFDPLRDWKAEATA